MPGEIENLGEYAKTGGPGYPTGRKNTATLLKERILALPELLDEKLGGEDKNWYLELAKTKPELIITTINKALPTESKMDLNATSELNINVKITKDSDGV